MMHSFGNKFGLIKILPGDRSCIDGLGRRQCRLQIIALRKRFVGKSEASAIIAFAGMQQFEETLRLAKGVAAFEQADEGAAA